MEQLPQLTNGGRLPAWPTHPKQHAAPRQEFDPQGPVAGPDLGYALRVLSGRKWLIAGLVAAGTATAALGVSGLSDKFTSEALLLVDNRQIRVVRDIDSGPSTILNNDGQILSEVEILKSDQVLNQVIAKLSLTSNPEFVPAARDGDRSPLIGQVTELGATLASTVWGDTPPQTVKDLIARGQKAAAAAGQPMTADAIRDSVLQTLHRNLTVGIVGRSQVVQVRYTAKQPEIAADVVDAIVARYMDMRQDMDRQMAGKAVDVMRERLNVLRREVVAAEQTAEQYRFQSGLTKGVVGTLAQQDLEQVRNRLTEASSTRARLVAQADALDRAARSGNWNAIGSSIASVTVGQLRTTLATLTAEMAQLNKQYGALHPRIIEQRARIDQAGAALTMEIQREIAGVREQANVAIDQEKALQEQISRLEGRYANSLSDEGVKLKALDAEVEAKRSLMDSLLRRLEEVQAMQDDHGSPSGVKLVSGAQVPFEPSGPQRSLLIAAGFLGSVFLSIFAVFALELLQRRVRTPDTIRRILGVANVHIVPNHPVRKRDGRLYEVFQRHPFSLFSESMRALFRNQLGDVGPIGSIAVTSARPQDGKTSLSLTVAQVAAQAGRRVVVVDTDFRRSRVDRLFNLTGSKGLADWMAGEASLDEIVYGSDDVPFAMVPAGKLSSSTLDRFNTDALMQLVAGLSTRYDLVVFDTAPALAVSDARIVCGAASKVLFVTRWGHTTAGDLQAIADLGPIDHSKFVTVLTDVDLKKAAARGYNAPYRNYLASAKYYGDPRNAVVTR